MVKLTKHYPPVEKDVNEKAHRNIDERWRSEAWEAFKGPDDERENQMAVSDTSGIVHPVETLETMGIRGRMLRDFNEEEWKNVQNQGSLFAHDHSSEEETPSKVNKFVFRTHLYVCL